VGPHKPSLALKLVSTPAYILRVLGFRSRSGEPIIIIIIIIIIIVVVVVVIIIIIIISGLRLSLLAVGDSDENQAQLKVS
jgi:hypothetical protein